jgi:CheY-like chemotaxis protein
VIKNKILFIDDEEVCHTLISLIISDITPFSLIKAYDGASALELAATHQEDICLIICDILLPDMNGYELRMEISNQRLIPNDIPTIFQSGLSINSSDFNKYNFEKTLFIQKPYSADKLMSAINSLLSPSN